MGAGCRGRKPRDRGSPREPPRAPGALWASALATATTAGVSPINPTGTPCGFGAWFAATFDPTSANTSTSTASTATNNLRSGGVTTRHRQDERLRSWLRLLAVHVLWVLDERNAAGAGRDV